jgi:hypothetical protein
MFLRRAFAFTLTALCLSFPALEAMAAPACSHAIPLNGQCEIRIEELRPTQSAIGLIQVEERAARMTPGLDGAAYTNARPLPAVQGPDGAFYVTDGHHLVSTLQRLGAQKVSVRIQGRFDRQTKEADFWKGMQERRWVYLFDTRGKPIRPSALPKRFADLADDPYRALAGYAQDAGYYGRSNVYYAEFDWARYFGARMGWRPVNRLNLLYALQAAEQLSCQPDASKLPGYAGPCRMPAVSSLPAP